MRQKHTDLSTVGEFGLIDHIRELLNIRVNDAAVHRNLLMGISDDAAVYRATPDKVQLLTTDAFVEGIHFDLTFTSFKHLGWKIMAANFSDIAAMAGVPRYATLALSLPKKVSLEMVEDLYVGASLACKKYSCLIVGGDTTTSLANIVISVTVVGEADEQRTRYRKGARVGDYLCVSGHLGASLAGLKILQREKERHAQGGDNFQPNLEPYAAAVERYLMPRPRLDLSTMLAQDVLVGAMIDVSDGLASEVHHLCTSSNVGAVIFEHNIPVDHLTQQIASEFSESPIDYALHGGEDYELLFSMSEEEFQKLDNMTNDITIVGRITDKEKGILITREHGEQEPLPRSGWDHFKQERAPGNGTGEKL